MDASLVTRNWTLTWIDPTIPLCHPLQQEHRPRPSPETHHALPPLSLGQPGRHPLVPRDLPLLSHSGTPTLL